MMSYTLECATQSLKLFLTGHSYLVLEKNICEIDNILYYKMVTNWKRTDSIHLVLQALF